MALVCIAGFTSCLENSGNRETGSTVGILGIGDKSFNYVIKTLGGDIYAPELTSYINAGKMSQGSGYYINYEIDYDLPENTLAMVTANGYYTVTLVSFVEAENSYLNYYLTDTSAVLPNEMAVLYPTLFSDEGGVFGFSKGYIFMTPAVKRAEDQQMTWNLSYDEETMMPTEENGKRYYDLYLRATKKGDSDKTTSSEYISLVAYNTGSYIERVANKEKELLGANYNQSSTFTLRIHYVSEIKDDDELVWKSQELPSYYIALFVSASE
jgi:hypothetical protein